MHQKNEIVVKKSLTPEIGLISVYAPLIAKKAKAGQFIILRVSDDGERIPLTISSTGDDLVTVVYQKVGGTTLALDQLGQGDCLHDFVGPLGEPTPIKNHGRVAVLGGGLGCAIALPVAKALTEAGNQVDLIGGFKTRDIVILEEEMSKACTDLHVCTDDGSYGFKGFVTQKLEELIASGAKYDHVFAIGPLMMMKFACVDGPDFDGHKVDFDEVIARNATYKEHEAKAKEKHLCRLGGGAMNG